MVAPPLSRGPLPRITCGTRAWTPGQVIHPGARPPTVGYSLRSLGRACNLITPKGTELSSVLCKPTKFIVVGRAGGWLFASAPTRRRGTHTRFRPAAARSLVARGERSVLALTSRSAASATQTCEGSSSTGAHRRRASPRRLGGKTAFLRLLWIFFCSFSSWSLRISFRSACWS